jgi:hypothetical protein
MHFIEFGIAVILGAIGVYLYVQRQMERARRLKNLEVCVKTIQQMIDTHQEEEAERRKAILERIKRIGVSHCNISGNGEIVNRQLM